MTSSRAAAAPAHTALPQQCSQGSGPYMYRGRQTNTRAGRWGPRLARSPAWPLWFEAPPPPPCEGRGAPGGAGWPARPATHSCRFGLTTATLAVHGEAGRTPHRQHPQGRQPAPGGGVTPGRQVERGLVLAHSVWAAAFQAGQGSEGRRPRGARTRVGAPGTHPGIGGPGLAGWPPWWERSGPRATPARGPHRPYKTKKKRSPPRFSVLALPAPKAKHARAHTHTHARTPAHTLPSHPPRHTPLLPPLLTFI